jgi:hypothetical protein
MEEYAADAEAFADWARSNEDLGRPMTTDAGEEAWKIERGKTGIILNENGDIVSFWYGSLRGH